jgi:DNA-binding response OmpR family regulator
VERLCIALVATGDELWGVEKIRMVLSSAGYRVIAIDNWDAIELITWRKPALIIASQAGFRSEEISLCKILVRRGGAPVVVISSPVDESQRLDYFDAGVTDFLTHPVYPRELIARVHNILQRTQPPLQRYGTAAESGLHLSPVNDHFGISPITKRIQAISKRFTRIPH